MGIIFKQRVQNPTIKDLRSFVRKTVTRDRSMYETDSQYDNETTFINRQRDQLQRPVWLVVGHGRRSLSAW